MPAMSDEKKESTLSVGRVHPTYDAIVHPQSTSRNTCADLSKMRSCGAVFAILAILCSLGCNAQPSTVSGASAQEALQPRPPSSPTPGSTGGFDGSKAYDHVRHLVELGPRPPGSDAIRAAQSYIIGQLKSFGCQVEEHDFHGSSPIGDIAMKNVIAKVPGSSSGIVLYSTHYDTLRLPNFVGADDGGSGVGMTLELSRVLCARKHALSVWIVFFDGEEAQGQWTDKNSVQWTDTNSTYGSREMAASMALSGDLKRVKAMILADMIGSFNLKIKRDTGSTPWLTDLIWATASRLGYGNVFVNKSTTVGGDDHFSFIRRGIAGCDVIDFDIQQTYWHTPEDTLDKVDPRSLAIVGHVFVELLPELERMFR
jgi:glutaminyl-peptide cyclotransferase